MEITECPPSGERKNDLKTIRFGNFDIASDYSDHHFIKKNQSSKNKSYFTDSNKPVYKIIMKEWKILEKHLPKSIYVRVYDERIDLLRAAIVGATQTPYHDGLFFFDIAFPSNYPNEPPKVYYHSHGLRLNPNLYANGFLCLSLVNTWNGSSKEKWRPEKSTILQLLVSIQGLVLNEKPFFNEPGYDTTKYRESKQGEKRSIAYSKKAFILSCSNMISTLRNPPKNFEALVFEHFHERKDFILGAFKAYRDGSSVVGYYMNNGLSSSSLVNISDTFKADSELVFRELGKALKKVDSVEKVNKLKVTLVKAAKLEIEGQAKIQNGTDHTGEEADYKEPKKKESSGLKAKSVKTEGQSKREKESSGLNAQYSTNGKPKTGILNKLIKWLIN